MPEQADKTLKEILTEAEEAERSDDTVNAIELYRQAVAADALNDHAYNRLMMLFRKQKKYKEELRIIKQGIKVFEDFYRSKTPRKSKAITELSNKLNRSTGLSDKKGNSLYDPEPIGKWKKRKLVVEKKIN